MRRSLLLVVALVALLVGDHIVGTGAAARSVARPVAIPALAPRGALSSTWYCPGLYASPDGAVRGRVIVANPSGTELHAMLSFVADALPPVQKDVTIPPYQRRTFRLEDEAPAAFTATLVSIDGDQGAVEQEVEGPTGESISPCATSPADHWYFASGRTDTGATTLISMYNPFAADAIADLRFATDQGGTSPAAYQGLVIPGRAQLVLDIGQRVRLRSAVATSVTVRSGRLIVDKIETQNGSRGEGSTPFHGLSLALGAPGLGTTWYFADGVKAPGATEHFDVYNPGTAEAHVAIAATLEQGSVDPFELVVPPSDRAVLQVDTEARIPPAVGQAWSVTSDVPVAVERVYEESKPAPHQGVADSMGTSRTSTRWLFAAGSAAAGSDEYLILFNPGSRPAKVIVTASGQGEAERLAGLDPLTLPPNQRLAIRVFDVDPAGIVVLDVTSDVGIVAERSQARLTAPGLSASIGIGGADHG